MVRQKALTAALDDMESWLATGGYINLCIAASAHTKNYFALALLWYFQGSFVCKQV